MSLSQKQKRFVAEYLKDLNGTQAAIRAGYSPKTADQQASRLLTKVKVTEAVRDAMKRREARTEVTQDRVIAELAKIAFTNGSDFAEVVTGEHTVYIDGTPVQVNEQYVKLKNTEDVAEDKKAAISGIKQGKNGIEISSCDKLKALELLGKHLGMFDKRETAEENTPDDGFMKALRGEAADTWQD